MAETEAETVEEIADAVEDEVEDIADAVEDAVEDATDPPETDVDVTLIEAPEPEDKDTAHASVDVGDLHISGPAEMVEKVTETYLKNHIDHNPHGEPHNGDGETNVLEDTVSAVTPDVVQETVAKQTANEIADEPPGPTDWLFRERS